MKRISLIPTLILLTVISFSQMNKMHIKNKPEKINNQIVGKRSANGEYCAAIKIVSNLKDLRYESYNGVVKSRSRHCLFIP